jgi:hypothetical protein
MTAWRLALSSNMARADALADCSDLSMANVTMSG